MPSGVVGAVGVGIRSVRAGAGSVAFGVPLREVGEPLATRVGGRLHEGNHCPGIRSGVTLELFTDDSITPDKQLAHSRFAHATYDRRGGEFVVPGQDDLRVGATQSLEDAVELVGAGVIAYIGDDGTAASPGLRDPPVEVPLGRAGR